MNQDWHRAVFETVEVGVVLADEDGRMLDANPAFLRMIDRSREDLIGLRFLDITHPDDRPANLTLHEELVRGDRSGYEYDKRYPHADGTTTTARVTVKRVGTEPFRSLAFIQDISDRTRAQRAEATALRERAMRECLFESAPDAIVLADTDRRIVQLNPAAEALFGWTTAEVRGEQTQLLYAHRSDFQHRGETHYRKDRPTTGHIYSVEYQSKDGRRFIGDTVGGVLRSADEVYGFVGIIRDVTDEAASRAELEQANARLEESLDALDQFAYIASHDLRTPLRGIDHVTRFLKTDSPADVLEVIGPRLEQLRERVRRMDAMLLGLLRLARSGHHSVVMEPTNLGALIREVEQTLRSGDAAPQPFELTWDLERLADHPVEADAMLMQLVLSNLVTNALVHHDGPSATIQVRAWLEDHELRLMVEDDGPGIPVAQHERVFEVFRTLAPKDDKPTTGMGLALVRRLLGRVRGRVWLESPVEQGRGCRVHVACPQPSLRATAPSSYP